MADKKRRNTPNTGNKRNNGRRKKKGRLKGLIAAELIVVVVLVMIVGHNLGLGTGITNFVNSIRKPAVDYGNQQPLCGAHECKEWQSHR